MSYKPSGSLPAAAFAGASLSNKEISKMAQCGRGRRMYGFLARQHMNVICETLNDFIICCICEENPAWKYQF